jgi:hypothetical protein
MHWRRWRLYGDPSRRPGQARENGPSWSGDDVSYQGAHKRHQKVLAGRPCASQDGSCQGRLEIALNHATNEARLRLDSRARLLFSVDERDYLVLCVSHHRRYDHSHSWVSAGFTAAPITVT